MNGQTTEAVKHYFLVRPGAFSVGVDLDGKPVADAARQLANEDLRELMHATRGGLYFHVEDLDDDRDADVILADRVLTVLYDEWGRLTGDQVSDHVRAELFTEVLDNVRSRLAHRTLRPRCGVCGGEFDDTGTCADGCATTGGQTRELASAAVTEWIDDF